MPVLTTLLAIMPLMMRSLRVTRLAMVQNCTSATSGVLYPPAALVRPR
jgi:hypothetical protein